MPPMNMMMAMGPDMMFMHQDRHADPEKRAQRLRDILQLRGDQDGALKAYVEATTPRIVIEKREVSKDDKKDGDAKRDGGEWAERKPLTTLERLDRLTKAADAMKTRAEATRAFYTALTPAQQKTFDILGMGEGDGDQRVFVRRFETRGAPAVFKDGQRKVVIQRKVG
ncbi:Spy/CpxP family protein refolding chaperone [Caulobacter sp. UC70_42]|uniref:Spy/CpxP family protein refolding chaperone n=1 Tax=Caulobacter sp. UC70_42 TaxID=3374551 RepID=UPI0037562E59